MQEILTGEFGGSEWRLWAPRSVRVIDWNIERGLKLPAIIDFLAAQSADLLVLQEVDVNARRTHGLNVAEEIARALKMNYVFGREFQELAEGTSSSPAYTGQATLSRWPLVNPRSIRFNKQSDFWHPRWYLPNMPLFQERRGGRIALFSELRVGGQSLAVYNLHLESRGDARLRIAQLQEVISDAGDPPALIAGDLNIDPANGLPDTVFRQAGFSCAMNLIRATTPKRGLFSSGRMIDRAFVRGPIRTDQGRVHDSIQASDHYPISFRLSFA